MCWNSTEKILVGLLAMARESIRERGYERSSRLGFPLLAGQRKQALSGRGVRPLAVQSQLVAVVFAFMNFRVLIIIIIASRKVPPAQV